ncbi:dihydrofolate reductase family protein [Diaminobutyricibacter sp. McL0608]|uniref:dihydrofolate reductase family protein n=1 Tax=Leifsonia sp. McL0608 TaxID=3143537 RepID=UPI0031F332F8
MGKIIISENITLDGVNQDEGFKHTGWFQQYIGGDGDEWYKVLFAEAQHAKALLLGRHTDEYFGSRWNSRTDEYANLLNGLPKYVVSSTLGDPVWVNSTILRGPLLAEVSKLKQEIEGDVVVYGSGQLARTLIENDLADELRLIVFPVVLGVGQRLFSDLGDKRRVSLIEAKGIGENLGYVRYEIGAHENVRGTAELL